MTVGLAQDPVAELVRAHAASLLRLARVHSLCDDDAADAYQRTLEIYLKHADQVDPRTAGAWLRTVCKHEAMRLRRSRQRVAPADPHDWDEQPAPDPHDGAERAASLERVARAAEALQACSPASARAMLLRADGASYAEIGAVCGWTTGQVNRELSAGRRRFLKRFSLIESGAACDGHLPRLMAIVDGEATADDYLRLRPHLRHCGACRAVLKAMYESEPALAGLLPVAGLPGAALAGAGDAPGWIARVYDALGVHIADRVARGHALLEAASAGKAAAVVASTAAVAVGGTAVVEHARAQRAPAPRTALVRAVAPTPSPTATPIVTPAPTTVLRAATPVPEATARATPPSPSPTPPAAPAATATVVATRPAPEPFTVERPPPARVAGVPRSAHAPGAFER